MNLQKIASSQGIMWSKPFDSSCPRPFGTLSAAKALLAILTSRASARRPVEAFSPVARARDKNLRLWERTKRDRILSDPWVRPPRHLHRSRSSGRQRIFFTFRIDNDQCRILLIPFAGDAKTPCSLEWLPCISAIDTGLVFFDNLGMTSTQPSWPWTERGKISAALINKSIFNFKLVIGISVNLFCRDCFSLRFVNDGQCAISMSYMGVSRR